MKKKLLISVAFTLLAASFSLGVSLSKADATEQETLKDTEYVYKLLGEEMSIGSTVISVQDPKGNILTPENGKILLDWASGSYTITYPTYIQDVRVYEKMPTDRVIFEDNIEEFSPTAGLAVELPEAVIEPGVYRTDGMPNPENYTYEVNVFKNGTLLETVETDEKYTFEIGGEYTLSYTYENVFGIRVAYDTQINVADEKVIVSNLLEEYGMCDGITNEDIFGYYMGEKYPTTITVSAPSGKSSVIEDVYYFNEIGVHNIYAETLVDGVEITLEKQFDIVSTLDDFIITTKGATSKGTLDKLSSTAFASNAQSYQVYSTGLSAQLDYNGVIDLREFDKNESIVEIVPNVLESAGKVEQVKITLTDVYDSANTVTVGYLANSNRNGIEYSADNVLVYVVYGTSGRVANANYYNMPQYAVAWYTSMYGYWTSTQFSKANSKFNGNVDTLNIAFDVENNVIYTHGIFYEVPAPGVQATPTVREWYPLLDLNDKDLAKPFQGFTTGEVYLKIETTGAGDIGIANIGKHTSCQITGESYQGNDGILLDDEIYFTQGIVGIEFPVTKALPSKYMQTVVNVEVRDPADNVVALKNNAFIPSDAGIYKINYFCVNEFGVEVQKSYTLTVLEEPTPIDIKYDVSESVLAGEWYVVKTPDITGGNGNIEYTIAINGKTVTAGETFKITDSTEIFVEAQDAFGQKVSKTWELNVDYNNVETEILFPRSAFAGEIFTVPEANFYEYATKSYNENYTVTYNGSVITEKTVVLPSQPCKVEFTYSLNGEYQKTYELNVLNKAFKSVEEVFDVDGVMVANTLGTQFKVNSNSVIAFPHLLSTNALNITFYVLESELDFDAVIFTLTALNGVQQKIMLRDLNKDKVSVYANGVDTQKTINRVKMVGTESDPEEYRNQTYYSYEFVYEEAQKGLIANDKIIYSFDLDCNGKAFNGFEGGVYLDISFQSNEPTASVLLRKISNQVMSDLAYSDGDIVGPQIYSNGLSANCKIEYGETMDFSTFEAFDVLSGESTLTLTLQLPDGSVKFTNASLEELGENIKITADVYGTYHMTVRMRDANGAISTIKINYVVEDLIPPVITINDKEDKVYNAGQTVTLLTCGATDNSNGNITYMVIAHTPLGSPICLYYEHDNPDELQLALTERGKYKICYYAIDVEGNIAMDYYYIMVR